MLDTLQVPPQRTPHGVRYAFRVRGTGALPQAGQRVSARYTGFLPDGHLFDSSEGQGGLLKFRVGRHEVIAGLDEVMPLLPVGSRVRVWIPAALAYAAKGVRHPDDDDRFLVPPGTPLVFELEIVGVR
ncbi:FKBP-type peptidyl-prolyl cis-trans isomerase [Hymenobacter agri]